MFDCRRWTRLPIGPAHSRGTALRSLMTFWVEEEEWRSRDRSARQRSCVIIKGSCFRTRTGSKSMRRAGRTRWVICSASATTDFRFGVTPQKRCQDPAASSTIPDAMPTWVQHWGYDDVFISITALDILFQWLQQTVGSVNLYSASIVIKQQYLYCVVNAVVSSASAKRSWQLPD